jgi:hemoglobin-like flavoprotein
MMMLTAEEKTIIKLSFAQLNEDNVNIAEYFYDNLFQMAPLIKPMFKSDRKIIEQHFYELISAAVNEIDHFESLRPRLLELGKRHRKYGAQTNHFAVVKAAFILSIQYALREKCNETMGVAWSKYINDISQVMIEGLSSCD